MTSTQPRENRARLGPAWDAPGRGVGGWIARIATIVKSGD